MSTDTDATGETSDVDRLASQLGAAIAELPEHERYVGTKRAVENDETAQELIESFERTREAYLQGSQQGETNERKRRELEQAHRKLQSLPVMEDYLQAQSALERRLNRVNLAISEHLLVDFGEQTSGCCQD